MLPEFLPGSRNKLSAIIKRVEENETRALKDMPTVGEETRATVAMLREKYPDDEWLTSVDELVNLDEGLDEQAEIMAKLASQARNN